MPQRFPEDIECIMEPRNGRGGLFISNLEAAENPLTLKRKGYGISAVITAAKGHILPHDETTVKWYLYLPADDHESFDIGRYFQESSTFIQRFLQETNVLVHCLAGVSRSASLVLAFLIKKKGYDYEKAYSFVRSRRNKIYPNEGFIQQLKKLEQSCRVRASSTFLNRNPDFFSKTDSNWAGKTLTLAKSVTSFHKTQQPQISKPSTPKSTTYQENLWKQIDSLKISRNRSSASYLLNKNNQFATMKKEISNIQDEIMSLKKNLASGRMTTANKMVKELRHDIQSKIRKPLRQIKAYKQ